MGRLLRHQVVVGPFSLFGRFFLIFFGGKEQTLLPPYIRATHAWLLENLHNPYPSKPVRDALSKETGVTFKVIDTWFTSTRKRIGWNDLRVRKFSNKRSLIVAAATRFFNNLGPESSAGSSALIDDFRCDFMAIYRCAHDLYSRDPPETSPERGIKTISRRSKGIASRAAPTRVRTKVPYPSASYPSPERSSSSSPEPLSPLISSSPALPPSFSRKRKNNDARPEGDPIEAEFTSKRYSLFIS